MQRNKRGNKKMDLSRYVYTKFATTVNKMLWVTDNEMFSKQC